MAYSQETDIEGEFKDVDFDTNTSVKSADITRFIAETDAYIDGKLGLRYQVPITGVSSLLIMRMISVTLISERVKKILAVKTGDSKVDQDSLTDREKAMHKMLQEIVEGKILLSDATKLSSHGGVKAYNYDNDIEASFDVTQDQW